MSENDPQDRSPPHQDRDSEPDRSKQTRVGEMIAECHRQLLDVDRVITESESQLIVVSESLTRRDDGTEISPGTQSEIAGARERIEEAQKRLEELTHHVKSVETQLQGEDDTTERFGFDHRDSDGDGHRYVRNTETSTRQTNPE